MRIHSMTTLHIGQAAPKGLSLFQEAILLADVSRLMGNPGWRGVFVRYAAQTKGQDSRTLSDLALVCTENLLDVYFSKHLS